MTRQVDREAILAMLEEAARERGMTLEQFHKLGSAGDLDNPQLRDLWLIWGDELTDDDLTTSAA